MVLSLVTGSRNRPKPLQRLVKSIIEHTSVPWELIIAEASDEPIEKDFPENVIVLEERPRLGMARGYNEAFKQASGKWVIWLNDDCTVEPGYAENAIRFMEEHPEVGLGALYYADKLFGHRVNVCCYGMTYANFGILSREFGNQIGWFDWECCPMYGSDNTIAYRTLIAGKGIAGIPDARIFHHSEDDDERRRNNYNREQDSQTLKGKYGPFHDQMRAIYNKGSLVPA